MIKYLEIDYNEKDINELTGMNSFAKLIQRTLNLFLWGKSIKVKEIKYVESPHSCFYNLPKRVNADGTQGIRRGL